MSDLNSTALSEELKISVDPYPTTLRATLLGILFVGAIVGYVVTGMLFAQGACSPLGLIIGVVFGAALMQGAEWYLRPRWKSNKFVELRPTQIHILNHNQPTQIINPQERPTLYLWRFTINRTHRVPKGWSVVAMAIEHNDVYIPIYCLLSPEDLEALPLHGHFTELVSKSELKAAGSDTMRIAGHQRRLLKAEAARDLHGVEMRHEDFLLSIEWIRVHFPEWLPLD